jgi:hypothetical protein
MFVLYESRNQAAWLALNRPRPLNLFASSLSTLLHCQLFSARISSAVPRLRSDVAPLPLTI